MASALADDAAAPRRVLAIDFRGRGLSSYDPNTSNYAVRVETADVIAVITAMGAAPAIVLGTSRGGMVTMELATVRPAAIAGAILNDIGPVIEPKGMMRIKGYVGKLPEPRNYEEGADILRRTSGAQFPKFETRRLDRRRPSHVARRKRPVHRQVRCRNCAHLELGSRPIDRSRPCGRSSRRWGRCRFSCFAARTLIF